MPPDSPYLNPWQNWVHGVQSNHRLARARSAASTGWPHCYDSEPKGAAQQLKGSRFAQEIRARCHGRPTARQECARRLTFPVIDGLFGSSQRTPCVMRHGLFRGLYSRKPPGGVRVSHRTLVIICKRRAPDDLNLE